MALRFDRDRRAEALAALEHACGQPLPVGDDWQAWAIVDGNNVLGAVLVRGNEVHIGVLRPLYLRGLARTLFRDLIERYGSVVTTVRASHAPGRRFVERLGFHAVAHGALIHYAMTRVKYD